MEWQLFKIAFLLWTTARISNKLTTSTTDSKLFYGLEFLSGSIRTSVVIVQSNFLSDDLFLFQFHCFFLFCIMVVLLFWSLFSATRFFFLFTGSCDRFNFFYHLLWKLLLFFFTFLCCRLLFSEFVSDIIFIADTDNVNWSCWSQKWLIRLSLNTFISFIIEPFVTNSPSESFITLSIYSLNSI